LNHGGGEVKSRFCEARDHDLWIRHLESGSGFEDQTSQIRTRIRIRIICSKSGQESGWGNQNQDQMSRLAEETGNSVVVLGGGGSRWLLISLC